MEYTSESLAELIFQIINYILTKLFSSIDKTIYSMLDSIVFIDKDILKNISKILGENSSEGLILISNSLILGFFIFYSFQYLLSHLTYKKIQTPSQFIFKSIIFLAIMNSSLWICEEIINIVSLLTKAINLLSNSLFDCDISFVNLTSNLNDLIYVKDSIIDIFSFDGIIKSFSSFGMLSLMINFSFRYVLIDLLVLISPFAFLSLILESSERFFYAWFKSFISMLLIQILLSLIILLSYSFSIIDNLDIQKLLSVASIFSIIKTDYIMKELLGGLTFQIKQFMPQFNSK